MSMVQSGSALCASINAKDPGDCQVSRAMLFDQYKFRDRELLVNSNVGQDTSAVNPRPCLCMGQLWTRREIIAALGIGDATLSRWVAAGLRKLGPGTKEDFFLSDDVISFMINAPDELPKFEADYKKKKRT